MICYFVLFYFILVEGVQLYQAIYLSIYYKNSLLVGKI